MSGVELESKTQFDVMTYLKKNKVYVYKNAQNLYTERGRPDLTACIPVKVSNLLKIYKPDDTIGLFVGIEMKRPGKLKNVSLAQEIVGRQIQKAGGIWLPDDNVSSIIEFLTRLQGGDDVIQ